MNPHFPIAIAIGLWMAHSLITLALVETERWPRFDWTTIGLAVGTLALVSFSPFTLGALGGAYGATLFALWLKRRQFPLRELAWGGVILISGLPLFAYNTWAISAANPVMAGWAAQNLVQSAPIPELLIGYGPLIGLAGLAVWRSRRELGVRDIFLIGLLVSGVALAISPFNLQSRFMIGFCAYASVYAGMGLKRVVAPAFGGRLKRMTQAMTFAAMSITSVVAMAVPYFIVAAPRFSPANYMSRAEGDAMRWLEDHAGGAVVLESPELGLLLPMRGVRVVYGHHFETVRALERKQSVLDFYSGTGCDLLEREHVGFVVVGPRERALAGDGRACPIAGREVFTSADGQVVIFEVDTQ